MRLATILASMILVLGLAAMGCDSGDGDSDDNNDQQPVEDTIAGEDTPTLDDDVKDPNDMECQVLCAGRCGIQGECACGGCEEGFVCDEDNVCVAEACVPNCTGKQCGSDGCDGDCGECEGGLTCNETTGMCEDICVPDCDGKQCGPDGCDGSCGLCPCVGCDPSFTTCDEIAGLCIGQSDLTCSEINDCMSGCNPDDQACLQDCSNQGSMEAQGQLNGLIQCLIDNGAQQCPPGDTQCQNDIILEHCMTEFEACFPAGTDSCSDMFDCMGVCPPEDMPCLQACYSAGTADAQAQYQAIASCVIEQCGEVPTAECSNAAQQGACAAVFADCFNMAKPGFATGANGGSSADFVNLKMWTMGLH